MRALCSAAMAAILVATAPFVVAWCAWGAVREATRTFCRDLRGEMENAAILWRHYRRPSASHVARLKRLAAMVALEIAAAGALSMGVWQLGAYIGRHS